MRYNHSLFIRPFFHSHNRMLDCSIQIFTTTTDCVHCICHSFGRTRIQIQIEFSQKALVVSRGFHNHPTLVECETRYFVICDDSFIQHSPSSIGHGVNSSSNMLLNKGKSAPCNTPPTVKMFAVCYK